MNDALMMDGLESIHQLQPNLVTLAAAEPALRIICLSSTPSTHCMEMNRTDPASP
jgi:hypothetical protein